MTAKSFIVMQESADQILKQKNVKPTAMRQLVLDILRNNPQAVSLLEIEQQLDSVDRSTIFRTLKTFQENCIIHKIDDGTGATKFALCSEGCSCNLGDLHAHFYCNKCGQTSCLKDHLIVQPVLPDGFSFESANYVIKGICANCR